MIRRFAPLVLLAISGLAPIALPAAEAPAPGPSSASTGKTCLVLSGGGARGVAHIGVLRVLEEMRVPVDCVVGTSMGSIVGAAWVSGRSPEEMETVVRNARWDVVLGDEPERPRRSWRSKDRERDRVVGAEIGIGRRGALLPGGAVIGQQLEGFLQSLLGPPVTRDSFDEFAIPFRAIATDIESGRMKVLDEGILNAAVRASMSVPGVFAPQEIDGRLYVDGGLVRNLGIDVARDMGATRIIAVNLGTSLASRDEVNSLFGVAGQMINILTDQNVNVSLGQLRPGDVLIQPALGTFSAANFAESWTTIELGERAARDAIPQLAPLRVSAERWATWQAARREAAKAARGIVSVSVNTDDLRTVSPSFVTTVVEDVRRSVPADQFVDAAVEALFATDDFQQVTLRAESLPQGDAIVIEPKEKSWGPNYLRFGTTLSTNLEGQSGFSIFGGLRSTWLNARGLEWQTSFALGDTMRLRSELFQPLEQRQRWLAGVFIDSKNRIDTLFIDEEPYAEYDNGLFRAGLELRSRHATDQELRLGIQRSWYRVRRESGVPFATVKQDASSAFFRYAYDRLDDWDFPRSGLYSLLSYEQSFGALGGETIYRKAEWELQRALGSDRHSLSLVGRYGSSLGTDLPLVEGFSLGGFQNLSGYADRQIIANRVGFGRAVYAWRLGGAGPVASSFYLGGSLEIGQIRGRINSINAPVNQRLGGRFDDVLLASSMFFAADTALGPLYLALGFGEGGERAAYLFLGRP